MMPYFISIGWLQPNEPFRKITFLIALGMIMGAAIVDVSLILFRAWQRSRQVSAEKVVEQEDWKKTNTRRLVAWVVFWGICIVIVGSQVLHQPVGYLVMAVLLVFVFALVNGISLGITDSNPISSAFVVTVVLMAGIGLRDPIVGMMAATVLLVSTSEACDMQQDRSTGWRLGTNRMIQFRFQVAGIVMGAIMAVVFAKLFMSAYPVLGLDQTTMPADKQPAQWTSAMTYKFVGVLRSLTDDKPYQRTAIWIGILIGFVTEFLRKYIKSREHYQAFVKSGRAGFSTDFVRRFPQPRHFGMVRRRRRAVERRQQPAQTQRPAGGAAQRHEHDLAGRRWSDRRRCAGGARAGHRGPARHLAQLTAHLGGGGSWELVLPASRPPARRARPGGECRRLPCRPMRLPARDQ
jgi:MFS family permease